MASDPSAWTHRLGGLVAIRAVLQEHRIDHVALLADAGLPPDTLDDPDHRVPFAVLPGLLKEAARRADCPHFGLLVGARWLQCDSGLLKELVLSCATVGEALETLTVFQRLNSQGSATYLLRHPSTATLGFVVFQPRVQELAVVYDVALATELDVVRTCLGSETWAPSEVLLPRVRPTDDAAYRDYFRCRLYFDSEQACLRFPVEVLSRTTRTANAARKRQLESEAWRQLDHELLPRLYRSLRLLLLDGAVSGENIARHLSMHRRTLDRRLKVMGTSFKAVLDDVQFDVAGQLLRETDLPVMSIARAVGFNAPSSFVRAFRRWSGTSPIRWRKASVQGSTAPQVAEPRAAA